jgi:NACalpha-BTF3-like transcription factor
MCRHTFGATEATERIQPDVRIWVDTAVAGTGRSYTVQDMYNTLAEEDTHPSFGRRAMWRPRIRRELEQRYRDRPAEEYPTGTDPIDIDLIVEQTQVSRETAQRYLAYHNGDVVETVMCFLASDDDYPIPEFRRRERPALSEPYVPRDITQRVGVTALTVNSVHDGYESS